MVDALITDRACANTKCRKSIDLLVDDHVVAEVRMVQPGKYRKTTLSKRFYHLGCEPADI